MTWLLSFTNPTHLSNPPRSCSARRNLWSKLALCATRTTSPLLLPPASSSPLIPDSHKAKSCQTSRNPRALLAARTAGVIPVISARTEQAGDANKKSVSARKQQRGRDAWNFNHERAAVDAASLRREASPCNNDVVYIGCGHDG